MSDRRDGDGRIGTGQRGGFQAGSAEAGAPPSRAPERRDPFAHGDLPMRPTYLPEEGEGGRSEIWSILGGLAAAVIGILIVAWLVAQLY